MLVGESLVTETNCPIKPKQYSIAFTETSFDILCKKIYTNPTLAVVRELLTNAYEAHVSAHTLDIPIDVHFPSTLDPVFSIRDYGTGLSIEDINDVYTSFFTSTKNKDNKYTGGFGLGSKTPFAYTSSFSIISYFNGTKYSYLASKIDGIPSIILTSKELTNEHNGLCISIPCNRNKPFSEFLTETKKYLKYIPEIIINPCGGVCATDEFNAQKHYTYKNITIYEDEERYSYYYLNNARIKQGQNVYPISSEIYSSLKGIKYEDKLYKLLKSSTVVFEVPIGTLEVSSSREELEVSSENISLIEGLLLDARDTIEINFDEILPNIKSIISIDLYSTLVIDPINYGLLTDLFTNMYLRVSQDKSVSAQTVIYGKDYNTGLSSISGRLTLCNNRKSIILYVDSITKYGGFRALDLVLNHYKDLEDTNIHIAYINENTKNWYNNNNSILCAVRKTKNNIFILNSLEDELKFDIEDYFIKDFYKKYPRLLEEEKELREEEKSTYVDNTPTEKHIYIREARLDLSLSDAPNLWIPTYSEGKLAASEINDENFIRKVKSYDSEFVVITNDSKPLFIKHDFNTKLSQMGEVLPLCNTVEVCHALQKILNTDKKKFTFIGIAKTNMKLFKKNYKFIDLNTIKDIVCKHIKPIYILDEDDYHTDSNNEVRRLAINAMAAISNQSKKHQKVIKASKWYKKHEVIFKYVDKVYKYTYTPMYQIKELQDFVEDKYTVQYYKVPKISVLMSDKTYKGYRELDKNTSAIKFKHNFIKILKTLN